MLNEELIQIISLSLFVSSTSTLLGALIGIPIAILLSINNFKGKALILRLIYTLTGMPPVVVGLIVFLLIMRRGILGWLHLSFTPAAMIIAQTILITPIVIGALYNYLKEKSSILKQLSKTLGANKLNTFFLFISESKQGILTAIVSGFSRSTSEVGAVMIVGGNIKGYTRVMTTYISQLQNMGEYSNSITIGIILFSISFIVNSILYNFQYENNAKANTKT